MSVQLPALPLPKIVTLIPTRAIVHSAARDSSRMQVKQRDFGPAIESHAGPEDAETAVDVHCAVATAEQALCVFLAVARRDDGCAEQRQLDLAAVGVPGKN